MWANAVLTLLQNYLHWSYFLVVLCPEIMALEVTVVLH